MEQARRRLPEAHAYREDEDRQHVRHGRDLADDLTPALDTGSRSSGRTAPS